MKIKIVPLVANPVSLKGNSIAGPARHIFWHILSTFWSFRFEWFVLNGLLESSIGVFVVVILSSAQLNLFNEKKINYNKNKKIWKWKKIIYKNWIIKIVWNSFCAGFRFSKTFFVDLILPGESHHRKKTLKKNLKF